MKRHHSLNRWLLVALGLAATSLVQAGTPVASAKNPPPAAVDWKVDTISPVANPITLKTPSSAPKSAPSMRITASTTASSPAAARPTFMPSSSAGL